MLKPFWNKKGHLGFANSKKVKEALKAATKVVANPTLAGTEADLTALQVNDTKYAVPQPINIVANPTLAGTEADLTGLEVGNTKYKVPQGGGSLPTITNYYSTCEIRPWVNDTVFETGDGNYVHNISVPLRISGSMQSVMPFTYFSIVLSTDTPLTESTLGQTLYDTFGINQGIIASGFVVNDSDWYIVKSITAHDSSLVDVSLLKLTI